MIGETGELVRVQVAQVAKLLGKHRAYEEQLVNCTPARMWANRDGNNEGRSEPRIEEEEQMNCVGDIIVLQAPTSNRREPPFGL